jgi:C4-type Zn-finger protein
MNYETLMVLTCPVCNTQSEFKLFYEFNYICKNCGFRFDSIKFKENNNGREQDNE